MIKSSLYLTYDGIDSESLGVLNISIDSGLYEEQFLGSVNVLQQPIRGRNRPYFFGTQIDQKKLDLTLKLPDNFTEDQINEIARWLSKPTYYAPMTFSADPEKIYFCILSGDSSITHKGGNGYLKVTMLCNSSLCFSPVYTSSLYDFSSNSVDGTEIPLANNGDIDMFSVISVQVINGGNFSIVNKSNNNEELAMTGIGDLETITINTEMESVDTDAPLTYRYDNMSSDSQFIVFPRGVNNLQIYGNVKIQLMYEYRYLI